VQAELQRKYELLAQLEEKYGEDTVQAGHDLSSSTAAIARQSAGDLSVDIIEAKSLNSCKKAMQGTKSVRTNVKATVHGMRTKAVTKATAWRTGAMPEWHEKLCFDRRSRDDALLLQVRLHPRCLLDLSP
jgi:hypothetical protein